MGCGGSKLDDSDAVAFCKERSQLLEDAIRHRYSLAQSHLAYLHSLKSVASAAILRPGPKRYGSIFPFPSSPHSEKRRSGSRTCHRNPQPRTHQAVFLLSSNRSLSLQFRISPPLLIGF
ncbi:hypothetical protein AAC387_Pa02g0528 [Persea americana]